MRVAKQAIRIALYTVQLFTLGIEIKIAAATTRLGLLLRHYRDRIGLTQVELADLSTVSVRAVRNLELGLVTNPRRETVRLLADALRLSGERRAALQLAAGHDADDASFDTAPTLRTASPHPIYGREREIAALTSLLTSGGRSIIRVTGIGGSGKTRLVQAVSERMAAQTRMPTLWVSLNQSSTHAPSPLTCWVEGLLAENDRAVAEICRLIGRRTLLLVFDGNDTRQVSCTILDTLLCNCPNARIVVTSRTSCGRATDHHLPLNPLPVPAAFADHEPAIRLLLTRVASIVPAFALTPATTAGVAEICRLLDGVPLALESAAYWFLLSSPSELAEIARTEPLLLTAPPSQAAGGTWVHDTVASATTSLSPAQRDLLEVLADWDAPWTLDQVAGRTDLSRQEVAGAVHAMLTRGLIRPVGTADHSPVRFTTLNLVKGAIGRKSRTHPTGDLTTA